MAMMSVLMPPGLLERTITETIALGIVGLGVRGQSGCGSTGLGIAGRAARRRKGWRVCDNGETGRGKRLLVAVIGWRAQEALEVGMLIPELMDCLEDVTLVTSITGNRTVVHIVRWSEASAGLDLFARTRFGDCDAIGRKPIRTVLHAVRMGPVTMLIVVVGIRKVDARAELGLAYGTSRSRVVQDTTPAVQGNETARQTAS